MTTAVSMTVSSAVVFSLLLNTPVLTRMTTSSRISARATTTPVRIFCNCFLSFRAIGNHTFSDNYAFADINGEGGRAAESPAGFDDHGFIRDNALDLGALADI